MKHSRGFSFVLLAFVVVAASPALRSQGELDCFTADRLGSIVLLNWKTIARTNTAGFHVQRAIGATPEEWSVIGLVDGSRAAQAPSKFRFVDDVVTNRVTWYRVKCVDHDGGVAYSDAVPVHPLGASADIRLHMYPSPARGSATISFALPAPASVTATVLNTMGSVVGSLCVDRPLDAGMHNLSFDASSLQGGMYFLLLQTEQGSYTRPIFVAHRALRERASRPVFAAE